MLFLLSRMVSFRRPVLILGDSSCVIDVVMELCFGSLAHRIEADGFDPSYCLDSITASQSIKLATHLPWISETVLALPDWIGVHMGHGPANLVRMKKVRKGRNHRGSNT